MAFHALDLALGELTVMTRLGAITPVAAADRGLSPITELGAVLAAGGG